MEQKTCRGLISLESSDDEGPEDVLLKVGKDQAIERKRKEVEAVKRARTLIKEKRCLKSERYRQQKEAKQLKKLKAFPKKDLQAAFVKIAQRKMLKEQEDDQGKLERHRRASLAAKVKPSVAHVGVVKVVSTASPDAGDIVELSDYRQDQALKFLREHLYGERHKRIPVLSQLARSYRSRPALNFANPSSNHEPS